MMSKEQFEELMKCLKNMESKLDILVNLQRTTIPKPKISQVEDSILKLCDGKHSIKDMVKETGKKSSYVRNILTQLRKKGVIISERSEGKVIHRRFK